MSHPRPAPERYFVSCASVVAHPGYQEDRISIHRAGQQDPFALIALPAGPATPWEEALSAFGWRLTAPLEYIAGQNASHGQVEAADPAADRVAEQLRETVRREIRARIQAAHTHPGATQFQAVLANGDGSRDPIGWTLRVPREGGDHNYTWVAANGHVAGAVGALRAESTSRAEVTRGLRFAHAALQAAQRRETHTADLLNRTGPELAHLLLALRMGGPWIPGSPEAAAKIPAARAVDEQAPDDGPGRASALGKENTMGETPQGPFVAGDRVVCGDGATRIVQAMAPTTVGEPPHVLVRGGTQWPAADCRRANPADIRRAHERSHVAAAHVHQDPDPGNPQWAAALQELGTTLEYLKAADPRVRGAIVNEPACQAAVRVHPDAHLFTPIATPGSDQAVAFTFRTGHGAGCRYGVVTLRGEVSPVGLYEYPTTAERAYRQHLMTPVPVVEHDQADPDKRPIRYRGIDVPDDLGTEWGSHGAAQWRNGADAALDSIADRDGTGFSRPQ